MTLKAVLFGSLGVIAETSNLYRQAFNLTFEKMGMDWHWDEATYAKLLITTSGQRHLRRYADERGYELSQAQLIEMHTTKALFYRDLVLENKVAPRPGIVRLLNEAREAGLGAGLVTTTALENMISLFDALRGQLAIEDFDFMITSAEGVTKKPSTQSYDLALERLKLAANEVVAIEDSASTAPAAINAGIKCLATPGALTSEQDYSSVHMTVADLDQGPVTLTTLEELMR